MQDDDHKTDARKIPKQEGNVPVFHIDDDDLMDLGSMLLDSAPPAIDEAPHVHRVEVDLDSDAGGNFDDLLRRTLEEAAPGSTGARPAAATSPAQRARQRRRTVSTASGGIPRGKPASEIERPDPRQTETARQEAARAEAKIIEELRGQLQRFKVETQNYRKRIEADAAKAREVGHEDVFKALLPILDSLSEALVQTEQARDFDRLYQGLNMVVRKLQQELRPLGLTGFDSAGQPFDPNRHEAIQQLKTGRVPAGSIVQEVRRGYMMGPRLLRAALVIVEAS